MTTIAAAAAELDKSNNQSTQVAFRIVEELAPAGDGLRLTDLANRLGMPKPRIYRFLQTLIAIGYAEQDPATERYRLTLKLYHLGQAIADGTQLLSVARPVMTRLRDATEQTVTLSLIEAEGTRVMDIVRVETPVQIVTKPGALMPFHASAQGKLALAFGPPLHWRRVRAQPLQPLTARTVTDLAALEAEVAAVQAQGWAVAPEEALPGVNAISAPIFDRTDRLAATITLVGSVLSVPPQPHPDQIAAVCSAARAISTGLGYTEPTP